MSFWDFLTNIFGTRNERVIDELYPLVDSVNTFEEKLKLLSDAELRGKTKEFRYRLITGATVDDILPEAFAVVRESAVRVLGMRHFDVQVLGGLVLHQGGIAEMKTGEGKTLASTMPSYLNAIEPSEAWMIAAKDKWGDDKSTWKFEPIEEYKENGQLYRVVPIGKGVHIITVNDYLARRDRDWMGPVLELLGLNVGVLQNMLPYPERKAAYAADIG